MKNKKMILGLLILLLSSLVNAGERPEMSEHITFQYYSDLARATQYYSKGLGFKIVRDTEWYKVLQITPSSFLGLVDIAKKPFKLTHEKNESLLSLVVKGKEVQEMYDYIQTNGIEVPAELVLDKESGVQAFMIKDPEGYKIEIFSWL